METKRGFKEICVGNFKAQPGVDRWPLDSDGMVSSDQPRPAPWRSNLVALSQMYNLYFVAYQDKIHVTIPRGLQQTIPSRADLILDLPISVNGFRIGGYIDPVCPHAVNNIRLGNLGEIEILLIACDDGDVIAYYTHLLLRESRLSRADGLSPNGITKPFFHENVGISAWGLAIHDKSRLIAVGSNNREVTVFAFGFSRETVDIQGPSQENPSPGLDELFPYMSSDLDNIRSRAQNFRVVLPLGLGGHNIPSIDFASNSGGFAEAVLATDINGNLWSLGIWNTEKKKLPPIHKTVDRITNAEMGWGVLSLPLSYFRTVPIPAKALGVQSHSGAIVLRGSKTLELPLHFDFKSSINQIQQTSPLHPIFERLAPNPIENVPKLILCLEDDDGLPENITTRDPDKSSLRFHKPLDQEFNDLRHRLNNPTWSSIDDHISKLLAAGIIHARRPNTGEKYNTFLPNGAAIFQTYTHDIHLCSPCPFVLPSTVCENILKQHVPSELPTIRFDRLSMLTVIPELSLVIVASQIGRAALITLTKMEDDFCEHGPVVTCRLDLILPLSRHEAEFRPPLSQLLGMAVAPLQVHEGREDTQKYPRRWRLMLHYFDHTILSYELSREDDQIKHLVVF